MLALLAATAVHWMMLPNDKSPDGYVGWKLDEKQVLALDRRLALPAGAYPREQYVRYYAGHIAPDSKKTLKVALVPKKHPLAGSDKPGIYISYRLKGRASVPTGIHMGCSLISGSFDAHFQPIAPLSCSNEGA